MTIKLEIKLTKKGNQIELYIKAPKEIEDYYKGIATRTPSCSVNWLGKEDGLGIQYYTISNEDLRKDYDVIIRRVGVSIVSDFGAGLAPTNKPNISFLRAVGISEGITFTSNKFQEASVDLEYFVKYLGLSLKSLLEEYVVEKKVQATITYEI